MSRELYKNAEKFLTTNYKLHVEDLLFSNAGTTIFYGTENDGLWIFTLISGSFERFGLGSRDSFTLTQLEDSHLYDSIEGRIFGKSKLAMQLKKDISDLLNGVVNNIGIVFPIKQKSINIPGENMWMKVEMTRVVTENGVIISGLFADSTRYGIAYNKAIEMTYVDATTGLFNRNTLELHLEEVLLQKDVAFVHIDIDNFRTFNNEYSFSFGDKVLTYFGNKLSEMKDDNTTAYRVGSDEFFIIFKHVRVSEINSALLSLKRNLRNIVIDDVSTTIGFSFGVMLREEFSDISINNVLSTTDDFTQKHKESRKTLLKPAFKLGVK